MVEQASLTEAEESTFQVLLNRAGITCVKWSPVCIIRRSPVLDDHPLPGKLVHLPGDGRHHQRLGQPRRRQRWVAAGQVGLQEQDKLELGLLHSAPLTKVQEIGAEGDDEHYQDDLHLVVDPDDAFPLRSQGKSSSQLCSFSSPTRNPIIRRQVSAGLERQTACRNLCTKGRLCSTTWACTWAGRPWNSGRAARPALVWRSSKAET